MPTNTLRIYRALADQIIHGELAPGSKLEEQALAERFAVSRTPVREALRELSARGMIDLLPRRGGVVATVGLEQLADMLEAECEFEALCARLAAQRMSAMEKKQLQLLHEQSAVFVGQDDELRYLPINQEFHAAIYEGTHNRTIATQVSALRDRLAPFRQSQAGVERRLALSHKEHGDIVAAILSGDSEGAYNAMREHNARLGTNVVQRMRAMRAGQRAGVELST
jgi:DNA-binding GntR family transcriptional regulator